MIQGRAEEVFPGQRQRAGARTCFPLRNETGRTPTAGRPSHLPDGGFGWLVLAAEMAGLVYGGWRPTDPAVSGWPFLPRVATRTISADAGSVRGGRGFTVATLRRWDEAGRGHDVAVVVSELLTNALRHGLPGPGPGKNGARPIRLGLLQHGSGVLCAVADPGRAVPVPQAPGSLAETGRGLQMICALSDRWGYTTPNETGKVVWAVFDPRPAGRAAPEGEP